MWKLLKHINDIMFVAIKTNVMHPVEHAFNFITKGISNINNVILFNKVLHKRDADI